MSDEEIARIGMVQAKIDDESFVGTLAALKPDGVIHLAALQVRLPRVAPRRALAPRRQQTCYGSP